MRVFDKNDRVRTAMRSVLRGVLLTFVAFTVRCKNANWLYANQQRWYYF